MPTREVWWEHRCARSLTVLGSSVWWWQSAVAGQRPRGLQGWGDSPSDLPRAVLPMAAPEDGLSRPPFSVPPSPPRLPGCRAGFFPWSSHSLALPGQVSLLPRPQHVGPAPSEHVAAADHCGARTACWTPF